MKKLLLLPLALAFASNAAMAANSVDLRVTGTITPAACDITLVGGDVSLGAINAKDLNPTVATPTQTFDRTINILCSGATQVAIKTNDNRTGTNPPNLPSSSGGSYGTNYGLGVDGAGNMIGGYTLSMKPTGFTVNGGAGTRMKSTDGGVTWKEQASATGGVGMIPAANNIYSWALSSSDTQPTPVTNVSQPITIGAVIAPKNTLDTSSEITIDGSATIELVYL